MAYTTIDELRANLGAGPKHSPDYIQKMMHDLPEAEVVDRPKFILSRCHKKKVLEFGATGPMHDAMLKVSAQVLGVDREYAKGVIGFDLDDVSQQLLPPANIPDIYEDYADFTPEVIVCGEVIEHLANPGFFLKRLKAQYPGIPVVITVPNAFAEAGRGHLKKGTECVNIDHVAWYSYRTLRTLVERYGYSIKEFAYYNGKDGPTAEGLIAVVE